ncbi:MAG: peptide deformylase [Selenomonadaceae bacterium]|nr:peptide deformylase [Selenomonadaceae bacterium]
MAILEVVKAGNPVLKQIAQPIKKIDSRLRHLMDDMAETMYKCDGVGLAAPQVGQSIRLVVIDVGEGIIELINPVITHREGKVTDSEGCLSVPGIFGDVERAERVTVEYTTRFNKRRTLKADGLLARCIQHECDHLDGTLFIDIATSLRQETPEDNENG